MPTYEYACEACQHEFEEFQSITAPPLKKCPKCGKNRLQRLIGTGAGVIFRGSGFYQTDYRSDSYKKSAEAEKKSAEPVKTDAAKSESSGSPAASPAEKPVGKTETTPATDKTSTSDASESKTANRSRKKKAG